MIRYGDYVYGPEHTDIQSLMKRFWQLGVMYGGGSGRDIPNPGLVDMYIDRAQQIVDGTARESKGNPFLPPTESDIEITKKEIDRSLV